MTEDAYMTEEELEEWIDELDDFIYDYLSNKTGEEPDEDLTYSMANALACLIDHNAVDGLVPDDTDMIAKIINDELVESTAKLLVPEHVPTISEVFAEMLESTSDEE